MTICFVPGCKSRSNIKKKKEERLSFFSPPTNEVKFQKWQRMIPRKDRQLRKVDRVCQLHFIPEHILHDFVHIINGETVKIPRDRAILSEDAYPCIFPGLPKYLTKIPKIRKPPATRSNNIEKSIRKKPHPAKDQTHSSNTDSLVYCGLNLDEIPVTEKSSKPCFNFSNLVDNIDDVRLPSAQWGRHVHSDNNSLIFSHVKFTNNEFVMDKMVIINESLEPNYSNNVSVVSATTYYPSAIQSMSNLESVIRYLEESRVCSGLIFVPMFEGNKEVTIKKMHGKCKVFISEKISDDLCAVCKKEKERVTRIHELAKSKKSVDETTKKQLKFENRRLLNKVSQLTENDIYDENYLNDENCYNCDDEISFEYKNDNNEMDIKTESDLQ